MKKIGFVEAMAQILQENHRFPLEAYEFVREALEYTTKLLAKPKEGPQRHVTGAELLEGIRKYALQEYGPMAMTVLNSWNIRCCEDFGEIVFNLVNKGILGKTENDSVNDFSGGFEFESAFRKPFKPAKPVLPKSRKETRLKKSS